MIVLFFPRERRERRTLRENTDERGSACFFVLSKTSQGQRNINKDSDQGKENDNLFFVQARSVMYYSVGLGLTAMRLRGRGRDGEAEPHGVLAQIPGPHALGMRVLERGLAGPAGAGVCGISNEFNYE